MTYYEIPIAVQDRSFDADGSLFYPDTRAFFDEIEGPFIPETDLSPIWNPEFFGNTMMVNGATWPYLTVEQRRYRFRFLNGCDSRFLILDFSNIPGVEVWQIGNEGGFLPAPVNLTELNGGRLLMALAERMDLIVDFTNVPVGAISPTSVPTSRSVAARFDARDPDTTGQVMEFRSSGRWAATAAPRRNSCSCPRSPRSVRRRRLDRWRWSRRCPRSSKRHPPLPCSARSTAIPRAASCRRRR